MTHRIETKSLPVRIAAAGVTGVLTVLLTAPLYAGGAQASQISSLDEPNPDNTDLPPVDPEPTDPAPTDPAPTDPAPTDPGPTDPPPNPIPTAPPAATPAKTPAKAAPAAAKPAAVDYGNLANTGSSKYDALALGISFAVVGGALVARRRTA